MRYTLQKLSVPAAFLAATLLPSTGSATIIHNQDVTPDVIMGSGIPNGHFSVDRYNPAGAAIALEVGLRARLRPGYGSAEDSNDGTWIFHTGEDAGKPGWATWNVDWSVNVDFTGSTGDVLNDYTYLIGGEEVGGGNGSFDPVILSSNPIYASALACAGNSFGNNSTGNSGGVEVDCSLGGTIADYISMLNTYNVVQNSWNLGMANAFSPGAFDPNKPATYNFFLAVYDANGTQELARTEITVKVVPEPNPLLLLGIAITALGWSRRKRTI